MPTRSGRPACSRCSRTTSSGRRRPSAAALSEYRELGDERGEAEALRDLAGARGIAGDAAQARTLFSESVALFERGGESLGLARALHNFGEFELVSGDLDRAVELLSRALEIEVALSAQGAIAATRQSLGDTALERGDLATARDLYVTALTSLVGADPRAPGTSATRPSVLARSPRSRPANGRESAPAGCGARSKRSRRGWGNQLQRTDRLRYERALADVAGPAFDAAVESGRALTLDRAVREALA